MSVETGRSGVIAVAGEALIDLVPMGHDGLLQAIPGGSPANVAVGLARLNVPARMIARISNDHFGRKIHAHLATNGVDLSQVIRAVEPTSLAIVAVDQDGGAEYDFRVQGTADWQWHDAELDPVLDRDLVALHAGSVALTMPPGAEVLRRLLARARGRATLTYDPNCRPLLMTSADHVRDQIVGIIELADVVKASAEDITWLMPGCAPEQVAEAWLALGPSIVIITLGPDGAIAASRQGGIVFRPGRRATVADTVGAGDAFMSTLLAGLWRRDLLGAVQRAKLREIETGCLTGMLDEAILAATITCTRRGAEPPTAAELQASTV